jgi:hypothetical protein
LYDLKDIERRKEMTWLKEKNMVTGSITAEKVKVPQAATFTCLPVTVPYAAGP